MRPWHWGPEVQWVKREKRGARQELTGLGVLLCSLTIPNLFKTTKTKEKRGPGQCALGLGGPEAQWIRRKKGARQELTSLDVLLRPLTILNLLETKSYKGKKEDLTSASLALGGLRSNGSEEKRVLGNN